MIRCLDSLVKVYGRTQKMMAAVVHHCYLFDKPASGRFSGGVPTWLPCFDMSILER